MADRTLFSHAFGPKTPAPLWTAPALDRCLLLALLYPIAAVFIMWAVSGHVGPAEEALGLRSDLAGSMRGVAALAIAFSAFAWSRFIRASGWIRYIMWFAVASAFAFSVAFSGAFAFAIPSAVGRLSDTAVRNRRQGVFLLSFVIVAWIAAVLTLQAALGAILGVAVQALVAWGLIFHAMPAAGLDLARNLAALDLPTRVIAFLGGG